MVKNRCGQSCDGTLKLTVSEEWATDGINWFLHVDTDSQKLKAGSQKLKADQFFGGGHRQKWMWPVCSQDSKIGCL